jgi:competence protein ComEC
MLEGRCVNIIQSKSKTFLAFCFCFMIGAAFFSYETNSRLAFPLYISLFPTAFGLIIFWKNTLLRVLLVGVVFFISGGLRVLWAVPSNTTSHLNYYWGQTIKISGWISDEPDRRVDKTYYTVTVEKVVMEGAEQGVSGKLLIKTRIYPEYNFADEVNIVCQLDSPKSQTFDAFRYDKYLERQGVWSVCKNPKISLIKSGSQHSVASKLLGYIFSFKVVVSAQLARLWAEPENSFLAGLLYGGKSGLPPELSDDFSKTGVSHVIAVSGFNITIIATTLMSLLIAAGLYRRGAGIASAAAIIIFVIFTGATASVVRAAVMGLLVILAGQLGRRSQIGYVLVFAATFMTLCNPYVLLWDAGFQLSFLATIGLVYISPILQSVIARSEERTTSQSLKIKNSIVRRLFCLVRGSGIAEPLLTTFSAIIATLPLILFQFGRLSIVAPLVNVLVLWSIPWLMLAGFITLIVSFIFFPLGQIFAAFTHFGLRYVILVVTWFGRQSWSAVEFHLPWWGMVLMYVVFVFVIARSKMNTVYEVKS